MNKVINVGFERGVSSFPCEMAVTIHSGIITIEELCEDGSPRKLAAVGVKNKLLKAMCEWWKERLDDGERG